MGARRFARRPLARRNAHWTCYTHASRPSQPPLRPNGRQQWRLAPVPSLGTSNGVTLAFQAVRHIRCTKPIWRAAQVGRTTRACVVVRVSVVEGNSHAFSLSISGALSVCRSARCSAVPRMPRSLAACSTSTGRGSDRVFAALHPSPDPPQAGHPSRNRPAKPAFTITITITSAWVRHGSFCKSGCESAAPALRRLARASACSVCAGVVGGRHGQARGGGRG